MSRYFRLVLENPVIIFKRNSTKCQIITVPPTIIEKIEKFGKTFKSLTIETVKTFLADSKSQNLKFNL